MNRTSLTSLLRGWKRGAGKRLPALLAAGVLAGLLNSCGDNVVETKSESQRIKDATNKTASVSVFIRNGGGTGDISNEYVAVEFYGTSGSSYEVQSVNLSTETKGKYHEVFRGGVVFKDVPVGTYAARVSKTDYATYFIENIEVKYDEEVLGNDVLVVKGVAVNANLYPLTGKVTGSAAYAKLSKSKVSGSADGATVSLVFDDDKIEHRVFTASAGSDGKFSFEGLPAGPGVTATIKAVVGSYLSQDVTDVEVLPGSSTALKEVLNVKYEPGLQLANYPGSVEAEEDIVLEFSDDVVEGTISNTSIKVNGGDVDIDFAVSGKKVNVSPKSGSWLTNFKSGEVERKTSVVLSVTGVLSASNRFLDPVQPLTIAISTQLPEFYISGKKAISLETDTAAFSVTFSVPVDEAKFVTSSYTFTPSQAIKTPTFSNEGKTITFAPASKWVGANSTGDIVELKNGEIGLGFNVEGEFVSDVGDTLAYKPDTNKTTTPVTITKKYENKVTITVPDRKHPNLAILGGSDWDKDTLVLALADTGKEITFNLSAEVGDEVAGAQFKATAFWAGVNDRTLELTASGSTLKVKPNPSWFNQNDNAFAAATDKTIEIVFENIIGKSKETLKGSAGTNRAGNASTKASTFVKVKAGRTFSILSTVLSLPSNSLRDTIKVKFTEPVDTQFLGGKVTVATKQTVAAVKEDPSTKPPTQAVKSVWGFAQLADVRTQDGGKTVAITPLAGERWNNNDSIKVEFLAQGDDWLTSDVGVKLSGDNRVDIYFGKSELDISNATIAKAWIVDDGEILKSSSTKSIRVAFTAAKFNDGTGKGLRNIGDKDSKTSDGWMGGSYIIQGVGADGKNASYQEVWLGDGFTNDDGDTVVVNAWTSYDEVSGKIGGKVLKYRVTPKLGASLGQTAETPTSLRAYMTLATAPTKPTVDVPFVSVTHWSSEDEDLELERGASKYPSGADYGKDNAFDAYDGEPTDIGEQLAFALGNYVDWKKNVKSLGADEKKKQTLFAISFDDEVNVNGLQFDLGWKGDKDVDADLIRIVPWVDPTDKTLLYLLAEWTGTKADSDFANMVNSEEGKIDGSDLLHVIDIYKINLEITGLKSSGEGAPFALESNRKKDPVLYFDFDLNIDGIYFIGADR